MSSSIRHTGASSTAVVELDPIIHLRHEADEPSNKHAATHRSISLQPDQVVEVNAQDRNESLPSPSIASQENIERWNESRMNIARIAAAFWGFVLMGLNDATYGVSNREHRKMGH